MTALKEPKLTPQRLELLKLLSEHPGFRVTAIAERIAPRITPDGLRRYRWTKQGAARWGGGYLKPLVQAGWVYVNTYVESGVGQAELTVQGYARLVAALVAATPADSKALE